MSAEKTYTVNLTMTVTQTEINAALQDYKNTPNENPTLLEIITDDIQRFCYDDGQMHGSFQIHSITENT